MNNKVLIDRGLLQELADFCSDSRSYNEAMRVLATPAPVPDAGEGVEVVGYLLTKGNQLSRMSAGKNDLPLMTVAQHTRIVSALQAASPSAKDASQ